MSSPADSFSGSADALELATSVVRSTSGWIAEEPGQQGVLDLLSSVMHIARCAVIPELRQWNARNELLRRLPVELRLLIFSYLPAAALIRTSTVCYSWQRLIIESPVLWAPLDLSMPPLLPSPVLMRTFQLSNNSPLHVHAFIEDRNEARILDECLEPHINRLRTLRIEHGPHCGRWGYTALTRPAPVLRLLSFHATGNIFHDTLFQASAPRLQTLSFRGQPFLRFQNPTFPALQHVTTLTLLRPEGNLTSIIRDLPSLRTLYLDDNPTRITLPPLPAAHPLQHLILCSYLPSGVGSILQTLGYMRLERLEVEGYSADVIVHALNLWMGDMRPSALSAHVVGRRITIGLTPATHTSGAARHAGVFFSNDNISMAQLESVFRPPATLHFGAIVSLTLPRDLPRSLISAEDGRDWDMHRALFPNAPLPLLETLSISCGERTGTSLLDPLVFEKCGALQAPVLRRLALVWDGRGSVVYPVCPVGLRDFIINYLKMERAVLPEVFIDIKVGLKEQDEGRSAMEILNSCVGAVFGQ